MRQGVFSSVNYAQVTLFFVRYLKANKCIGVFDTGFLYPDEKFLDRNRLQIMRFSDAFFRRKRISKIHFQSIISVLVCTKKW